ncbi:MAG: hypothetical protein WC761_00735 [Candidatus Paceibacterota bacterium]|jgi:hypothetical protein
MFTRGQAIDFIQSLYGTGTLSNQGLNISVVCPICSSNKTNIVTKRKLVIRTDNLMCHCWVCNYKARNLVNLIKRFHSARLREYIDGFADVKCLNDNSCKVILLEKKLELPRGWRSMISNPRQAYYKYLQDRADPGTDMADFVYYWKFGRSLEDQGLANRIIMPSFDENGELNYYTARTIIDTKPKYINATVTREDVIFNEINIDWKQPLTIVEGPFDLIKCNWNATCLLGSNLTSDYKLFLKLLHHKTTVNLALDPDVSEKMLKIAASLHEYDIPVNIVTLPSGFSDVGEMTQSQFTKVLGTAKPYSRGLSLRTKIAGLLKNI